MQVYKITFEDGTFYIGATTKTAIERVHGHYLEMTCTKGRHKLIRQAFYKHGYNLNLEVLAECDNKELLLLAEMEAIEKHNAFNENNPLGLNMKRGGLGIPKEGMPKLKADWATRNKERLQEKQKEYYQANKERLIENAREYYETNKEVINERNREYSKVHKEEIAAYRAQYQKDNKEAVNANNRRYKERLKMTITPEEKERRLALRRANRNARTQEEKERELANRRANRKVGR